MAPGDMVSVSSLANMSMNGANIIALAISAIPACGVSGTDFMGAPFEAHVSWNAAIGKREYASRQAVGGFPSGPDLLRCR
jgi:hypothetical protein